MRSCSAFRLVYRFASTGCLTDACSSFRGATDAVGASRSLSSLERRRGHSPFGGFQRESLGPRRGFPIISACLQLSSNRAQHQSGDKPVSGQVRTPGQ
jgi:hypothetical protein